LSFVTILHLSLQEFLEGYTQYHPKTGGSKHVQVTLSALKPSGHFSTQFELNKKVPLRHFLQALLSGEESSAEQISQLEIDLQPKGNFN
jgi:hypothetical protein